MGGTEERDVNMHVKYQGGSSGRGHCGCKSRSSGM